ncbi:AMMECR1 domain protein [Candidatus Zixiibacteriota bacterium]|nr:AMMECR1 domain protein [candidate division Zixibacteria bacterium]
MAGKFYPADSSELRNMTEKYLAEVPTLPPIDGKIIAILVPHAGYIYSGPVAAYAYRLLENHGIRNVILCGPSHQYGFRGLSIYGPGIQWKTPLGLVNCNDSLCDALLKSGKSFAVIPQAHAQEHCLEVQLPFLQTVLNHFEIVPVIMGYPDPSTIDDLDHALQNLKFDSTTIMLISTDWQHYRPAATGAKMDSLGMKCLENLNPGALERYLEEKRVEMCGGAPAVAVLKAAIAKGANRVKILRYGDSGDITGDKSSVVGYVAAVIYRSESEKKDPAPGETSKSESTKAAISNNKETAGKFNLNAANKADLLKIARESIIGYLRDGKIPQFKVSYDLQKFGAAFVTLTENDQLRGCIGYTTAVEPLYATVSTCAVQAAVNDPRFPPVRKDEIEKLHIEISVLTPLQKVDSIQEIEIGRDGLMIFKGSRRGLLLPQVATDYGWDITKFLEETCLKAGLAPNDYQSPDAIIYRFQAVIFGE